MDVGCMDRRSVVGVLHLPWGCPFPAPGLTAGVIGVTFVGGGTSGLIFASFLSLFLLPALLLLVFFSLSVRAPSAPVCWRLFSFCQRRPPGWTFSLPFFAPALLSHRPHFFLSFVFIVHVYFICSWLSRSCFFVLILQPSHSYL